MNLVLNTIVCAALALVTLGVSLYRKYLEDHCDHYIHLHNDSHDASVVTAQSELCKRIEMMDKLRKGLMAATIVYAVAIAGFASYSAWNSAGL
ncbi:MAG: hypothetical protein JWP08_931 [Bryobacterales bacterium]|nr:hypothetical protein [Bryobacterales bacterium]